MTAKNWNLLILAVAAASLCAVLGRRGITAESLPTTGAQTETIVAATRAFLSSLSTEQREKVQFSFTPLKKATVAKFSRSGMGGQPGGGAPRGIPNGPGDSGDGHQRPGDGPGMGPPGGFVGEKYGEAVWSNYPVSDVPRPGLRLGSLNPGQRDAATHALQVLLSPKGYEKVLDIMGSDQALSDSGTPFASGIAAYTIGIFGNPSTSAPWMLEFGGHHLALNITVAAKQGVITPTLTGAQPSLYTSNGRTVRVLAQENDKAFALLNALNETQRKQAILNYHVNDLVLGPGQAGVTIQPEGLKASTLNERQRAMLLDLISEWAGILNNAYAAPRMAEIKAGLDDTYFAWSGPRTHEPGPPAGPFTFNPHLKTRVPHLRGSLTAAKVGSPAPKSRAQGAPSCPIPSAAATSTPKAASAAPPPSAAKSSATITTPSAAPSPAAPTPNSSVPISPHPEDLHAVQSGIAELLRQIAMGHDDHKSLKLTLATLALASANLARIERNRRNARELDLRERALAHSKARFAAQHPEARLSGCHSPNGICVWTGLRPNRGWPFLVVIPEGNLRLDRPKNPGIPPPQRPGAPPSAQSHRA